jgi:TfoX/Sxy family transcriptional regulator of competence genes
MAYDEKLASRIRDALAETRGVTEKKMFGGLCFLVNGKMVCGVLGNDMIAKVGRENHERVADRAHVRPFDFTGRPAAGMVYVEPAGLKTRKALESWVRMGTESAKARG